MKLVDAEAICKNLNTKDENMFKQIVALNIYSALRTAPVAYDIEKVIEALEAEARSIVDNQGKPIGKCIDINRAVEIVRAGSSAKEVQSE